MNDTGLVTAEAENAVIGTLLIDTSHELIPESLEILKFDDFYVERNRKLFLALQGCFEKGGATDTANITEELRLMNANLGDYIPYMVGVTDGALSELGYKSALNRMVKSSQLRKLNSIGRQIQQMTLDTHDPAAIAEVFTKGIDSLFTLNASDFHDLQALANEAKLRYEQKSTGNFKNPSTGIKALDALLTDGGLGKSTLTIAAARPGMGKSAWAFNDLAISYIMQNKNVGAFSLEMDADDLFDRMVAARAKIDLRKLTEGSLSDSDRNAAFKTMDDYTTAGFYIDDSANININSIMRKCRGLHRQKPLDLVIVDYLQLMGGETQNTNRNDEIGNISRKLKMLSRELKTSVVCLSQLNRKVEERANKRPSPSDLRDSGAIEQDADNIFMFYREGFYNPNCDSPDAAEIIIPKQRKGKLGTVDVYWHGSQVRYDDLTTKGHYEDLKGSYANHYN